MLEILSSGLAFSGLPAGLLLGMRLSRCRVKDSRGVLLYRELCCLLFVCSCFSVIAIVIKRCTPRMLAVLSAVLAFSLLCCVARLSTVAGPHSPLALLSCHRFWRSLTGWFSSVLVQPCPSFLWQELLQWFACGRFVSLHVLAHCVDDAVTVSVVVC